MAADSGFFQWVVFLIGEYGPRLLRGAGVTLLIALIGTIVGCIIGLLVGVIHAIPAREIKNPLRRTLVHAVQGVMAAYVEIFRGTPMIVSGGLSGGKKLCHFSMRRKFSSDMYSGLKERITKQRIATLAMQVRVAILYYENKPLPCLLRPPRNLYTERISDKIKLPSRIPAIYGLLK